MANFVGIGSVLAKRGLNNKISFTLIRTLAPRPNAFLGNFMAHFLKNSNEILRTYN